MLSRASSALTSSFVSHERCQPDGRCFIRGQSLARPYSCYHCLAHFIGTTYMQVACCHSSSRNPSPHYTEALLPSAVTGNLAILIVSRIADCIILCTKNTGIDNRPKWSQLWKAPVWPDCTGSSDGAWEGRRKWATDARPRRKCIRPSPAVIKLVPYRQISSKCWHIPYQTSCRVQFPFLRPPVASNTVTTTTLRAAGNHGSSTTQHVWELDSHGVVTE